MSHSHHPKKVKQEQIYKDEQIYFIYSKDTHINI